MMMIRMRVRLSLLWTSAIIIGATLIAAPVAFAQFGFPTRRIISGANLPARCTSNSALKDIWYKTGASAGLYVCTSADTWSGPVGAASGDVVGPASATDTAIALFDGLTGKVLKNSTITVDGSGNVGGLGLVGFTTLGVMSHVENVGFTYSNGFFAQTHDISALGDPRTITWPDAAGTVTLGGNTFTGTGSVVRATAPTLTTPVAGTVAFAALGTPADGTFVYCSDCTKATPCAGSGSGAFAKRIAGAWDCD